MVEPDHSTPKEVVQSKKVTRARNGQNFVGSGTTIYFQPDNSTPPPDPDELLSQFRELTNLTISARKQRKSVKKPH